VAADPSQERTLIRADAYPGTSASSAGVRKRPAARTALDESMVMREQTRARLAKMTPDIRLGEASRLETVAVGAPTLKDYLKRLQVFFAFCVLHVIPILTDADIDLALLEIFDHLFLDGKPLDAGTKLLAAVGHHWPRLHRSGNSGLLPRARRALQGWNRVAPLPTRLPLPWPVVAGLAMVCAWLKEMAVALAIMVTADGYLRPCDLMGLRKQDVIQAHPQMGSQFRHVSVLLAPFSRGIPTKTHEYNDSVVFNSQGREWIGHLLYKASLKCQTDEPVFDFTMVHWNAVMKKAARLLVITHWEVVPYLLRHSGPSEDYLSGTRSLLDIQRRGRWKSAHSVRRYEKSARVTSRLDLLTKPQLLFMKMAVDSIQPVLASDKVALDPSALSRSQLETSQVVNHED
jgi:hypothetical protein